VDEKASDAKLQRVCGSPNFRHVIATNHFTEKYLRDKGVPASKIVFIEGGVVPRAALMEPNNRKHFGIDKDTLDIAFIANRYMPTGEDKGYDLFVAAAEALEQGGLGATYHVIGPWDANVIPLGRLAERFRFHGFLETGGLRQLCQTIDLIISPNRPNRLAPGAFDGFPTGSCVEAGLQQAAIFCTDAFKLNVSYEDGADIVVIEPVLSDILRKLMPVLREPAALAQLGKNARTSLVRVFGLERQLTPRLSLLRGLAYS
jgi:glycosyltransferase involved in cell wall biosynthesis